MGANDPIPAMLKATLKRRKISRAIGAQYPLRDILAGVSQTALCLNMSITMVSAVTPTAGPMIFTNALPSLPAMLPTFGILSWRRGSGTVGRRGRRRRFGRAVRRAGTPAARVDERPQPAIRRWRPPGRIPFVLREGCGRRTVFRTMIRWWRRG